MEEEEGGRKGAGDGDGGGVRNVLETRKGKLGREEVGSGPERRGVRKRRTQPNHQIDKE